MLVTEADGPTSTPLVLLHPIHLPAYLHTGISFTRCGFGQRDRRRHETEPLRSLLYSRFLRKLSTSSRVDYVEDTYA